MTLRHLFALLAATSAASSIAAPHPSCSSVIREFKNVDPAEFEGCICDERLNQLYAPFRNPFRVVAACHMQWGNGPPIVLGRESIRLDRYTNNDYPKGVLFVAGETQLDGRLLYSPGPAGEFWFKPDIPLLKTDRQQPQLPELKFTAEPPPGLRIPVPMQSAECWRSNVKLRVRGIKVVLWDNDEAGSWPIVYKVQSARDFTLCSE